MNQLKRVVKYLYNKVKYSKKVKFDFSVNIQMNSFFEGYNAIYKNSTFYGYMGRFSYLSNNCLFQGKIGRFSSIGPHCIVTIGTHPYTYPYVSTSPVFFSLHKQCGVTFATKQTFKELLFADNLDTYSVEIGNDCWIGSRVTLISGIKIGDGAVVLAGAMVTKDVPPYAVVGGVPAKIIKYRYNDEDIDFLLKLKWWDKDKFWIKQNASLFMNLDSLKSYFEN